MNRALRTKKKETSMACKTVKVAATAAAAAVVVPFVTTFITIAWIDRLFFSDDGGTDDLNPHLRDHEWEM